MSVSYSKNDHHLDAIISNSKDVMNDSNLPEYAQLLQLNSFNKLKKQLVEQKRTDE